MKAVSGGRKDSLFLEYRPRARQEITRGRVYGCIDCDHRSIGYHIAAPSLVAAGSRDLRKEFGFERWHTGLMSTADQTHASALTGEALLAAQSETFQPLLDHLAAVAEGQEGLRAEVAGELAGDWFAHPEGRQGHELIAARVVDLGPGLPTAAWSPTPCGLATSGATAACRDTTQPTQLAERRFGGGAVPPALAQRPQTPGSGGTARTNTTAYRDYGLSGPAITSHPAQGDAGVGQHAEHRGH